MGILFINWCIICGSILFNNVFVIVYGHGRLVDPPGRNSMWRYGFKTPVDYNDNQLFCGGFNVQHFLYGGKCGVCGDVYGQPSKNQPPGIFASGIISKNYPMNSIATMWFEITASHRGYLEFRLCPNNDITRPVTQECLDRFLLSDATTGGTKFFFNHGTIGTFGAKVVLPMGLTCTQCVLQWRYRTGNSWGCKNDDASVPENCGMGMGRQEEFYSCADISIGPQSDDSSSTSTPVNPLFTIPRTTTLTPPTMTEDETGQNSLECFAIGGYRNNLRIDWWCKVNCRLGNCPQTHCSHGCKRLKSLDPSAPFPSPPTTTTMKTTTTMATTTTEAPPTIPVSCIGVGMWRDDTEMAAWCNSNCEQGHCPPSHCQCSKDGALIGVTPGYKCKTVIKNITNNYRMYLDLWCKHNCPTFGCWNIRYICECKGE